MHNNDNIGLRGTASQTESWQGGGKPRPYSTRAWQADPWHGRCDPRGRPGPKTPAQHAY